MKSSDVDRMRERAQLWLRESRRLRGAGFNLSREERHAEAMARDVLKLCDAVEEEAS